MTHSAGANIGRGMMKGGVFVRTAVSAVAAVMIWAGTALAQQGALETAREAARPVLNDNLPEQIKPIDFVAAVVAEPGGAVTERMPPSVWGQIMYMQRHFDLAAAFFDMQSNMAPQDATSLTNLAAMLVELNAHEPDTYGNVVLKWALEAARHAIRLAPDEPGTWHSLARAAEAGASALDDADLMIEARIAAEQAVALDDSEPLYWTTLARLLRASGDETGAEEALNAAAAINANDPAYWVPAIAMGRSPEPVAEAEEEAVRIGCDTIDFRCEQICPKGLLAGPTIVTCKLEEDTQRNLCTAGERFATQYDCEGEAPVFALPFVNSGFSACNPVFCIRARMEPDGSVTYKIDAGYNIGPFKPYLETAGRFDPSGGVSNTRLGSGIRYNLISRGVVAKTAATWNVAPAAIVARDQSVDGAPAISLDVLRHAVIGN